MQRRKLQLALFDGYLSMPLKGGMGTDCYWGPVSRLLLSGQQTFSALLLPRLIYGPGNVLYTADPEFKPAV
ncbi:hypothetical protein ACOMHN_019968 [Nucella lapillus]